MIEFGVKVAICQKISMDTALDNAAVLRDQNLIGL